MSSRTLTSPSKSLYLSPKRANVPENFKTVESVDPEDDEKAFHVADINSKYQKRLMKPLQLNQRLKLQQEMTNFESERQFYKRKFALPSNEDLDKKHLIDQVQELAKISAYHDREANGITKGKKSKKLISQPDVLQQHLDAGLYDFLKDINTKVYQRQRQQAKQELEKEALNLPEASFFDDHKSTKNIIQKQLEAVRESKEKKLIPKQLNSNNYFRHSQRKLLYLRTAEAMNETFKQEEASESFFNKEAEKAKEKRRIFQNSLTRSDLFNTKRTVNTLAEKSIATASLSPNKMTQSALVNSSGFSKTAQGFYSSKHQKLPPSDHLVDPEETLKLRNNSTPSVNPGIGSPFELRLNTMSQSQPFNFNMTPDEISPVVEQRGIFRKSSHPRAERKSISLANEQDEFFSQRIPSMKLARLETKVSMVDEENPQEEESPLLYPPTTETLSQSNLLGRNLRKIDLTGSKVNRQRSVEQEETVQESNLESEIPRKKESFRTNLLDNIKKAKSTKALSFKIGSSPRNRNLMISPITSPTSIKSPTFNEDMSPVNRLRFSRMKNPLEETQKKRKKKNGSYSSFLRDSQQNFHTEQNLTRDASEDKKPLKEEMENLLNRYGYKDSMIEIKPKPRPGRKIQGGLFEAMNRDAIAKVDKLLQNTNKKATKVNKID